MVQLDCVTDEKYQEKLKRMGRKRWYRNGG